MKLKLLCVYFDFLSRLIRLFFFAMTLLYCLSHAGFTLALFISSYSQFCTKSFKPTIDSVLCSRSVYALYLCRFICHVHILQHCVRDTPSLNAILSTD